MAKGERIRFNGFWFYRYPNSEVVAHHRYYRPGIADTKRGVESYHREVWKFSHGSIPAGHHIHHRDGDWNNNSVGNLECLSSAEHRSAHAGETSEVQCAHLDRVRPLASAWHASPEGLAWHSEHGKRSWQGRAATAITCHACGTVYETYFASRARFCSLSCQSKGRHKRKPSHELICKSCKSVFMAIKGTQQTCSYACRDRMCSDMRNLPSR